MSQPFVAWRRSGDLKARIGDGGIRYFSYWDVKNLKERRARKKLGHAAEMRLAAFRLFERGVAWQDVALQLHYDPLRVHYLWELYSMERSSGLAAGAPKGE